MVNVWCTESMNGFIHTRRRRRRRREKFHPKPKGATQIILVIRLFDAPPTIACGHRGSQTASARGKRTTHRLNPLFNRNFLCTNRPSSSSLARVRHSKRMNATSSTSFFNMCQKRYDSARSLASIRGPNSYRQCLQRDNTNCFPSNILLLVFCFFFHLYHRRETGRSLPGRIGKHQNFTHARIRKVSTNTFRRSVCFSGFVWFLFNEIIEFV